MSLIDGLTQLHRICRFHQNCLFSCVCLSRCPFSLFCSGCGFSWRWRVFVMNICCFSTMSNKAMMALEKFNIVLVKMLIWPLRLKLDADQMHYVVFVADIVWNNWSFMVHWWCLSPSLLKNVSPTQQINIRSWVDQL